MKQNSATTDPWAVEETRFPHDGSPADILNFCLNYAILAPSTHNTQPWLFRQSDDTVEIYADRARILPVADPHGRELVLSCGAALMNLVVALHHFGHEAWVQYFPDRECPDLLARLRLGHPHRIDYHDESLFRAIRRRRTTRLPFQSRQVPRALQRRLIWLASEYRCWLYFVENPAQREQVASLVDEGDRRQLSDPAFREELAAWIHPQGGDRHDGMSAYAFGLNELLDFTTPLIASVVRTFDVGRGRAASDRELLDSSPVLVVLGSDGDTPEDWLRTGQAMQQMLLRAGAEDVTASFLNQPCEIPDLRERLRAITGRSGPPQLLMRLGYATPRKASPRRPLSEVLLRPGHLVSDISTLDSDGFLG